MKLVLGATNIYMLNLFAIRTNAITMLAAKAINNKITKCSGQPGRVFVSNISTYGLDIVGSCLPLPPGAYLNHNPSNACNKPKQIDTLDAWGNQQREQSEIAAYGDSWGSLSKAIHRLVDSYSNGNFPGKTKK